MVEDRFYGLASVLIRAQNGSQIKVTEACGWEQAPQYLIRDRAYGDIFIRRLRIDRFTTGTVSRYSRTIDSAAAAAPRNCPSPAQRKNSSAFSGNWDLGFSRASHARRPHCVQIRDREKISRRSRALSIGMAAVRAAKRLRRSSTRPSVRPPEAVEDEADGPDLSGPSVVRSSGGALLGVLKPPAEDEVKLFSEQAAREFLAIYTI